MYAQYFRYLIRHKWFVFIECCRLGIPIRGLLHDWSKILPDELIPYVKYFYGTRNKKIDLDFDYAWLKHIHRNKHHWQYWILVMDESPSYIMDMPDKYRKEMLADWIGAGKAQGKPDVKEWYSIRREKIQMSDKTREWMDRQLGIY